MNAKNASQGHRLTVYLPQPLYRKLRTEARVRKLTMGKVVRERLESEQPTILDVMGDLVGSVQGGPSDLSTNPKWMAGFGEDVERPQPPRE